ncbi:hypothetical protein T07_2324 [Trichinella nelsoni]|uniref:C2H2-type domain-containing protein n=1 Tax=Trichinella nelsoni TaxID=6336 RepID=A0A0V0RJJ0_9BILA|nr:hypothetical protein T07_2324 [Trichinella nelsoni]
MKVTVLAMGKRKNSQSEQDKSSLPTSGTEKQSTQPPAPAPPPAAIAAAAAAIAAAAATAGGDDLYTKTKIYGKVVKQLRDGASPSTVFQMPNEPQPLDLRKITDKDRPYTYASTSSSSRANKDSVRKPRTTRKRKSTELPSTSSTHSSQPQIPLSHFFQMTPRSPEIADSPQISSQEAISNAERNATASILSSILQKNTNPSSTMAAPSNPNSSIFPTNYNYPPVNLHQTGNQRTDVSLAQQALVNNQQMNAPSNPNSSIFPTNYNYPPVNLHQTGNQRTDVSLAQQALVNNQQMNALSNPNSSIFSTNENYPPVNLHQTGNQRTDVSLAQQALVNNQQMPAASNPNPSMFPQNDNYLLLSLRKVEIPRTDVSLAQQALVNNQQMPAASNPSRSIFPKIESYPPVNLYQTGNQRTDVNLAQQALVNNQQMPAASNPSRSIFPKIESYPPVNLYQTGNQRTDVNLAQQALVNNQQVVKPHPIRFDSFQHPIPFSSAFASYIAGMQHGVNLPPSLSNFQQSMNIANCSARDISSVDDYYGTTSKMNFSINLYLAMRMFVDALVQADNYIIGYSGYSICHLCGEKFNIYLLFIYHTFVHCCEMLKLEKHNFVIWNLFVADYISVVKYSIPTPFEIMLSLEQSCGLQNPTSSDKQRSDPKRFQRGKENECVPERDKRFTSGTSGSEQ